MGAGRVTLVESDRKKIEFLREAARITNTQVNLVAQRVEDWQSEGFDIIVSRATAPLSTLFAWAHPHVKPGGICLFHKGANWDKEWNDAQPHWQAELEAMPSCTSEAGRILRIKNIARR
jgi:16S rRNA (guanine527-N7)-methyltransferase